MPRARERKGGMSTRTGTCDRESLERYWLGDLEVASVDAVEEHLFACEECATWLEELAALQAGIVELIERGELLSTTSEAVLARAAERGVRLRSYRISSGGTVHCTIAPDDAANVVRLAGPFPTEGPLDVVVTQHERGEVVSSRRSEDVPVDRASGEILLLSPGEAIRALPVSTFHVDVLGRSATGDECLIGRYTLEHTPWPTDAEPA